MIIKQILKASILTSLFALISCLGGPRAKAPSQSNDQVNVGGVALTKKEITNRCIRHKFKQGLDQNLYGRDCIEGKRIEIKTTASGEYVPLMNIDGGKKDVVIEKGIDFPNKFYNIEYDILGGKGDDKKIPFLLDLFTEGEKFKGMPNQRYTIIFKTVGNYLVLYKASEDKNNIPFHEISMVEETKIGGDSLYMVPFIGYSILYCKVEPIRNPQQEKTIEFKTEDCNVKSSKEKEYLLINLGKKQVFKYLDKTNTFLADFFKGDFFVADSQINSSVEHKFVTADLMLTTFKKTSESLESIDKSGGIINELSPPFYTIPVQWQEFELDKQNDIFKTFGEKLNEETDYKNRPFVRMSFQTIEHVDSVEEILISPDYFSFVYNSSTKGRSLKTATDTKEDASTKKDIFSKNKVSFLRKSYVKDSKFKPRRWFLDELNKTFFLIMINPQFEIKDLNLSTEDLYSPFRVIKFDTGLYTEEEQKAGTKTYKWYFSKNSVKESYYREVVQEALDIYNRGYEIIADGEAPKIQYELEKEEQSLGDTRYNIINLIKISDLSKDGTTLLGFAPTYANPDTGQAIAGVSNISIHYIEGIFKGIVRDYTYYEIFQRPKLSEEENKIHVVSDYIRWKIQKECKNLESFIDNKRGTLDDYRTDIKSNGLIEACAVKVSRPLLLTTILHELGHNNSKHHNFECSRDEKNFYKNLDEMKKYFPSADLSDLLELEKAGINPIPKSSCVMDYANFQEIPLPVLGKNDLMILRYVYEDELELEGHELENPIVHQMEFDYQNLENQTSLTSNSSLMEKKKEYLNCPVHNNRLGCEAEDYGASYKEIVENKILSFKRKIKLRYIFDLDEKAISPRNVKFFTAPFDLYGVSQYHERWLHLRDNFLRNENLLNADSVTDYEKIMNPNNLDNKGKNFTQEYKDYYPIADVFTEAVKLAWFQRPLHCRVESKDEVKDIELNYLIYSHLLAEYKKVYVIDCYSKQVVEFLNKNDMKLIDQYGIQNFNTYSLSDENKRLDILPLEYMFKALQVLKFIPGTTMYDGASMKVRISNSLKNLSFLMEIYRKTKDNLLDINQYASQYEIDRNKELFFIQVDFYMKDRQINRSESSRELYKKDTGIFLKSLGLGLSGYNSFYQSIENPLNSGQPIESFQSSFLKKTL